MPAFEYSEWDGTQRFQPLSAEAVFDKFSEYLLEYGEYILRQEKPRTPLLFLSSGIDNPLNNTAFTFGGGIRWRDDDLKYLLGSVPIK